MRRLEQIACAGKRRRRRRRRRRMKGCSVREVVVVVAKEIVKIGVRIRRGGD